MWSDKEQCFVKLPRTEQYATYKGKRRRLLFIGLTRHCEERAFLQSLEHKKCKFWVDADKVIVEDSKQQLLF